MQVKIKQVSLFVLYFAFMVLLVAQEFKHVVFEPKNDILRLG